MMKAALSFIGAALVAGYIFGIWSIENTNHIPFPQDSAIFIQSGYVSICEGGAGLMVHGVVPHSTMLYIRGINIVCGEDAPAAYLRDINEDREL